MNLQEAILKLESFSDDLCIVAKRPWTPNSECELIELTAEYAVPASVKARGFEYFLEIFVANYEVLNRSKIELSPKQKVEAVIFYAENDAFPEWLNELSE